MNAHATFPIDTVQSDGRERIVAALRARSTAAEDGENAQDAAPDEPALPTLIEALGDEARAPQTEFVRERQVLFLESLSLTGSARSAAAAAGVSHQTAYRARRASRQFRLAWDAALLAARVNAEQTLACRALDGIEEQVFYHGEVVATRRRYSDRLLLAHLARLDKLTGDAAANAFAEDFDTALARFARGEEQPEPAPEPAPVSEPQCPPATPGNFSPGQCNTRSMSPGLGEGSDYPEDDDCLDEDGDSGREQGDADRDWDEDPEWLAEVEASRRELLAAMDLARPAGAKPPHELGGDEQVEGRQIEAFDLKLDNWWAIVTDADLEAAYRAKGSWNDAPSAHGESSGGQPGEPPAEYKSLEAPPSASPPRIRALPPFPRMNRIAPPRPAHGSSR